MGRSHGCHHWSHECYRWMEANRSHECYQWSHGCYNSMGAALQDDSGLEGLFACAQETLRADTLPEQLWEIPSGNERLVLDRCS